MLTQPQPQRTLPADVFDALELSAEAYGGIGEHTRYSGDGADEIPCCIIGHAQDLDGVKSSPWCGYYEAPGDTLDALRSAFRQTGVGVAYENDSVISEEEGRITFTEWCKRLNVVRGE